MKRIYLDYNSTSPLTAKAREALFAALDKFGNPSSVHAEGRAARAVMQQARREVAALIHADPENIIFTSGATEAAATLLTPHYFMGRSPLYMSHLYYSATEHPCISSGGRFAAEMITSLPVDGNGLVQPDILSEILAVHDRSRGLPLVAVQYANHETGVIQPIGDLAAIVRRAGGLFIVDAVQAAAREKIDITKDCGDFFILSSHKIGGPKGAGAFITTGGAVWPVPLLTGGGQERGFRGGTEALPLLAAFGAAAAGICRNANERERLAALQKQLEEGLLGIAPDIIIHGRHTKRLPNTTFFTVPGMKAETMQIAFDLAGIAVSAGAACSSGKVGASPVLKAMGITDLNGAIRVSSGRDTQAGEILCFLEMLQNLMSRKKNNGNA